jgi:hypothetical protein
MARPMATRWRWPPESSFGLRSSRCSIWRMRAASFTRVWTASGAVLASFRPKAMFS